MKGRWEKNDFSYSRSPATVTGLFLTGTGPLSVVVDMFNTLLFFQSCLVQMIIQRSKQIVHYSLVSLQHQFYHTSERLEEGGNGKIYT